MQRAPIGALCMALNDKINGLLLLRLTGLESNRR